MATVRPSELDCERTIIDAARLGGWRVHGERSAMNRRGRYATPIKGDVGFPDLILCRGSRLMALELKRWPRTPDPAQLDWLAALALAGADARVVYVPDELDALCQELANR